MNRTISIEPVYNDRCPDIINLILPIQKIEFNVPITIEDQPDLLDIETHYHSNGGCFWAALNESEVVGTIALMATGEKAATIRKMFVKQEFRGKEYGIAQKLFETLAGYCRRHGIDDLYLGTVGMLKAAHRFYERNGFERIEVEKLPSFFPRMMADHIFYHARLQVSTLPI